MRLCERKCAKGHGCRFALPRFVARGCCRRPKTQQFSGDGRGARGEPQPTRVVFGLWAPPQNHGPTKAQNGLGFETPKLPGKQGRRADFAGTLLAPTQHPFDQSRSLSRSLSTLTSSIALLPAVHPSRTSRTMLARRFLSSTRPTLTSCCVPARPPSSPVLVTPKLHSCCCVWVWVQGDTPPAPRPRKPESRGAGCWGRGKYVCRGVSACRRDPASSSFQ